MRMGVPKLSRRFVNEGSSAEDNLRKEKAVLWTEKGIIGYALVVCGETPSKDVCKECVRGSLCEFSKVRERK